MKKEKRCIDCGKLEIKERRRCSDCAIYYNRKRAREYGQKYRDEGRKPTRYGVVKCVVCGEEMIKCSPNQIAHGRCSKPSVIGNYSKLKRSKKGNMIARQMVFDLGIALIREMVVHHIDEDVNNNILSNFMIMSVPKHAGLHRFLFFQWKAYSMFTVEQWRVKMVELTKEWIKLKGYTLTKIDVSKVSELKIDKNVLYVFDYF